MQRLYQQIYLTIFVSLIIVMIGAVALWQSIGGRSTAEQAFILSGNLAASALPPSDADPAVQRQAVEQASAKFGLDISLFDADRRLIASAGRALPIPEGLHDFGGRLQGPWGSALGIRLPDARWIVVGVPPSLRSFDLWRLSLLGGFAVIVAVCCYPIVRRLTRRLECLQAGVESLGAGNLAARVEVEGSDEVARLAESFNRAAMQIEELVGAHKLLLANVSHELRTPLSRLRLGIELIKETADPKRKAEFEKDIAELDALIEQVLLSSRLDASSGFGVREDVDLLALAAEEGAHYDECSVVGEPCFVRGDPALLRRVIRNLIENARQHGKPPIEIEIRPNAAHASLVVSDHGPGIPAADRERVFSPFHRAGGTQGASSGLGLALVRQIARQHGGDAIWAGSEHCTSAIRVTIPIEAAASPQACPQDERNVALLP